MAAGQVRLENIGKRYGELWAVRHIDLEIATGEFYTLLGPSGCGKTTLLRTIAGFVAPDEGAVFLDRQSVNHLPPWKRNLGMVFQNYALWPHMTVFENVAFGLKERKLPRREIEPRVLQALEQVGLKGTERRRPSQLSGGQQQRVALARTVVIEPEVLLLDEPLSNLDARLRVEMRVELRQLQRKLGITAIYVTHDQEDANAIADSIAVLDQGRIQQIGTPIELYDRPVNRFVATFLGTANLIEGTIEPGGRFVADGISLPTIAGAPGRACISIRPQDISVGPHDGGIPARIAEREFLGGITRYHTRAGSQSIVVDVPHRRGGKAHDVGDM